MTPDEGLFPEQLQPWLFWEPDCFSNQDRAGGQKACDPQTSTSGHRPYLRTQDGSTGLAAPG